MFGGFIIVVNSIVLVSLTRRCLVIVNNVIIGVLPAGLGENGVQSAEVSRQPRLDEAAECQCREAVTCDTSTAITCC